MKKVVISIIIVAMLLFFLGTVYAAEPKNLVNTTKDSGLIEMKNKTEADINESTLTYGSEAYGMTAYILSLIQKYSMPFCFLGIAVGALYQYVLGTRRLDMKQKGFGLIILFITILVICQVLPLIFAIIVRGWRG